MRKLASQLMIVFLGGLYTTALAQCSVKTPIFEGELTVTETDGDGFPTVLAIPPDEMPIILLSCPDNTSVKIQATSPNRTKDGGPILKGKQKSFILYKDKIYNNLQTLNLTGGFEDLPLKVSMSIKNGDDILPASPVYKYQVTMMITVTAL